MEYKEFCEQADIQYSLKVFVNDTETVTVLAETEESLLEQLRKVDHAIDKQLRLEWDELPESEV